MGTKFEKQLSILHLIGATLALISLISTAIVWNHWSQILDTCSWGYCGCVLFSEFLLKDIHGGRNILCHFVVFSSIPIIIVGGILSFYHAARSCFRKRIHDEIPSEEKGCICWPMLAGINVLCTLLILTHAIVYTVGYTKTCNSYRQSIVLNISLSGQSATVVHSRLNCLAIYDFMDYLEPFQRPYIRKDNLWRSTMLYDQDVRRDSIINSGVSLAIGLTATWISFIFWLIITIKTIAIARRIPMCLNF